MGNKEDEYKELLLFARYMEDARPVMEQYTADYYVLNDNADSITDPQFIRQLFDRATSRLITLAQVDPPQSMRLAHIKMLQVCSHFVSAFQAVMDKDTFKSIGHLSICTEIMKEVPPLIEPMNEKLKTATAPLVQESNKAKR